MKKEFPLEEFKKLVKQGKSRKKIAKELGYAKSTIQGYVTKTGMGGKYPIEDLSNKDFLDKIDTKEKAYIVGFLLGDGHITKNIRTVSIRIAIRDKHIVYDIEQIIPFFCTIKEDYSANKKQKRFPNIRLAINNKHFTKNLLKFFGGRLKTERHTPIIKPSLEKYLLLGYFDADGGFSWGYRKDRNRLWQKINFTGQLKTLIGIQKILLKYEISTIIKPKKDENCFLIEFANESDVYKFYKLLPTDIFRLKRKITKFEEWLKALKKKYSFKEKDIVEFISITTMKKHNLPVLDYKGKFIVDNENFEIKVPSYYLKRKGIFFAPLRLELDENGETLIGLRQYRAKPTE